jgi:hypothetical protein
LKEKLDNNWLVLQNHVTVLQLTEIMNGFTSYVPCRLVSTTPHTTLKKTKNILPEKRFRFPLIGFALSSVPFLAIVVLLDFNFSIWLWID